MLPWVPILLFCFGAVGRIVVFLFCVLSARRPCRGRVGQKYCKNMFQPLKVNTVAPLP